MSPPMPRLGPKKSGASPTESSLARSSQGRPQTTEPGPIACRPDAGRVSLCNDDHGALRADEAAWQAARFGGYQALGFLLGELRFCTACESGVVRLIRFSAALRQVVDHLLRPQRPDESFVHAATVLSSWAQSSLPEQLGISAPPLADEESPFRDLSSESDWRQIGQELRQWRERAGLSRAKLSALCGVADLTIRNCETGRHRPRTYTLRRLRAVPALGIESPQTAGNG